MEVSMKRILHIIVGVLCFISYSIMPVKADLAGGEDKKEPIVEIETNDPSVKKWDVTDGDTKYVLVINYAEHYIQINDEIIPYSVEEFEIPATRTTIDYSTGRYIKTKIPWKGSVTLLAAAIAGVVGGISASGVASTIASALTADAENVWVTFTQYDSKETYHSNYYNVDYKKCINKNVTYYKTSVSASNKIYGPLQGYWFDPIRP